MRTLRLAPFVVGAALLAVTAFAQPPAEKADLLNFANGDLPNDTGSDQKTYSLADQPDLGKCLKVEFPAGDSVGVRLAKVADWKRYATLEFDAFNPGKEDVKFGFNVAHRRSTNYQTRIETPFTLKPGKNHVRLGIDEMANVNGSAPDLAHVTRWFIASQSDRPVTAYFGNISPGRRRGGRRPAASAGGLAPNTAYRVQGTIGDLKVDLLITPVPLKAPAAPPAKVGGDPARLERIRAAKMPTFDKPVLFDAPEADAIVSALEVFPPDNPWNLVVSDWPLHPNSKNLIASIGVDKPMRYNADMGFVLAPPGQKKVDVKLGGGADESDQGPYPVPDDMPIEGWPQVGAATAEACRLDEIQRLKEARRPARHRRGPGQPDAVRVLPGAQDGRGLGGVVRGDVRPEVEQAAARRLDLDRRGRAADLSLGGALRRAEARQHRTRPARHRRQVAARLRLPGHALRQPAQGRKPAAHGRAHPPAPGFRRRGLHAGGADDPEGAWKKYGMFCGRTTASTGPCRWRPTRASR